MSLDESAAKTTEHQAIYRRVREMILFGELAPGSAVTIHGVGNTLEAGMTPVREALRRLTAEGALEARGNRRLYVPRLTLEDLGEISFARLEIEPELAAQASQKIEETDVDHLLSLDNTVDDAIDTGNIQRYLEYNYRFHFTLYEMASAPILCRIARMLWLRAGPSLRVVCGRFGTSNLPDKHSETLDALRSGDAELARSAIREDIHQGMEQIRCSLEERKI